MPRCRPATLAALLLAAPWLALAGCPDGGAGVDGEGADGGSAGSRDAYTAECPESTEWRDGACRCLPGYRGPYCTDCAEGYYRFGERGELCIPGCDPDPCSGHGECTRPSYDTVACICDPGWAAPDCAECVPGHELVGDTCVDLCAQEDCSGHGDCDSYSGRVICFCDVGWGGTRCETCAVGYLPQGGACLAVCQEGSCSGHGSCDGSSGVPVCTCRSGYTGDACELCSVEYQLVGDQCVHRCQADTCSGHGSCDASTGVAVCTCQLGYAGDHCETCALEYEELDGSCVHVCASETCSEHGTCDGSSGAAVCACYDTAEGERCQSCVAGYDEVGGLCMAPPAGIAARGDHTCVWFADGTVRCWGLGYYGELGFGALQRVGCEDSPVYALGAVPASAHISHVSVGTEHACAVTDSQEAYCWGSGDQGMLGYGSTDTVGLVGTVLAGGPIQLGASATSVHAGTDHTCAVLEGGDVRCWGRGSYLGGATNQENIGDDELPTDYPLLNQGWNAQTLTLGYGHTCALLWGGGVRCWGYNGTGQLGYGLTYTFVGLSTVGDQDVPLGASAVQVVAGHDHSCALLMGGAVRCWGSNAYGQLGIPDVSEVGRTDTPADHPWVAIGVPVVQIAAGENHTCARLDTGGVRCWGNNGSGQLGYGSDYDPSLSPAQRGDIDLPAPAVDLALGEEHSCAVLSTGAVRCWGHHDYTCALGVASDAYTISDPSLGEDVALFH